MSEEAPSKVHDRYWLRAYRKVGNYPEHTERSGKWLIFAPLSEIDEWWDLIKPCTENGLLGGSSKVATARPNPNAKDPNIKVICVYTYDSDDKEDVMKVREGLRKLGVTQKIPYKEDRATLEGKYQKRGYTKISKYYV